MNDLISRSDALSAMWKALYEYEDKTEKRFQESEDLDVSEWIMNDRMWVQNGHNLCVNVIASLPSAELKGKWKSHIDDGFVECPFCGSLTNCDSTEEMETLHYCFNCGADMRE